MNPTFTTTDNFIIRQPLYPISMLRGILCDSSKMLELFKTEEFKRSIIWVSEELFHEYDKYLSGTLSFKDKQRMHQTLLKYAIRMTTRPTPFGEFASIGIGTFKDFTDVDKTGIRKKWISLDAILERSLFEKTVKSEMESVSSRFKYVVNGTLICKGKYLYHLRSSVNGRQKFIALDKTGILERLLYARKKSYTFNELKHFIFGDSTIEEHIKEKFISSLISSEILMPACRPEAMEEPWIRRVLSCVGPSRNGITRIEEILKSIEALESAVDITSQQEALKSEMGDHQIKVKNPLQVVSYSYRNYKISEEIKYKVIESIDFFSRISPRKTNINLQNFKKDFQDRYDHQTVPLLEALNPEIGIGYANSCLPNSNELVKKLNGNQVDGAIRYVLYDDVRQLLQRKIKESDSKVIFITDDDVKNIHPNMGAMPASVSAVFNIFWDKDSTISELHFSGSSATCMIGRFTLGNRKVRSMAATIAKHENNYYEKDGIIAEVNLLPNFRCGNVNYRSRFRKYRICCSSSGSSFDIPLNDLAVFIENDVIKLKSIKRGAYIIPRLSSAHNNYAGSDVIYQFLGDLHVQNELDGLMFSWGTLRQVYTHLPRVYYNNIILSLEEWCVDTDELKKKNGCCGKKYRQWVRDHNLPRYVKLIDGDNELLVDNDCELSVNSLMAELSKHDRVYLREVPVMNEDSAYKETKYFNQIIIPILKTN